MSYETVLIEDRDNVRYITLNRPERRNALSPELLAEIVEAIYEGEADEDVGSMVLRGAGTAFCSGFDITPGGPPRSGQLSIRDDINSMRRITRAMTDIWNSSKPVIAQIHGYCVAGGTDLAMHCDMIVAAEDARIGFPPVRAQGGPPTHMWTYHMGPQWAKRMLLTGDFIDGKTAERAGMVLEAVPADELEAAVHDLASRVAMVPHDLLAINKSTVNRAIEAMGRSLLQDLSREADAIGHRADANAEFRRIGEQEGLRAALAWRDAKFERRD